MIKYKGYPDSENTWEPRENLSCPKIIRDFEKKWKAKRRSKRKSDLVEYYEVEYIIDKRYVEGEVDANEHFFFQFIQMNYSDLIFCGDNFCNNLILAGVFG